MIIQDGTQCVDGAGPPPWASVWLLAPGRCRVRWSVSGASETAVCGEHAHEVGPDVDHGVLLVEPHHQAGGSAAEDLALAVQAGGQGPEVLVDLDLFGGGRCSTGGWPGSGGRRRPWGRDHPSGMSRR